MKKPSSKGRKLLYQSSNYWLERNAIAFSFNALESNETLNPWYTGCVFL